jgi:hypothetical protein
MLSFMPGLLHSSKGTAEKGGCDLQSVWTLAEKREISAPAENGSPSVMFAERL